MGYAKAIAIMYRPMAAIAELSDKTKGVDNIINNTIVPKPINVGK